MSSLLAYCERREASNFPIRDDQLGIPRTIAATNFEVMSWEWVCVYDVVGHIYALLSCSRVNCLLRSRWCWSSFIAAGSGCILVTLRLTERVQRATALNFTHREMRVTRSLSLTCLINDDTSHQRWPSPISSHEIWNSTHCVGTTATSQRLSQQSLFDRPHDVSCHWIFCRVTQVHSKSFETTLLSRACASPY